MLSRRICCCGGSGPTCQIGIQVLVCAGTPISGVDITVKQGTTTIGTCTTGTLCYVTVPSSGTYTISGVKSGYVIGNKTVTVTCPGTTNVTLWGQFGVGGSVNIKGCRSVVVPGATFTFDSGSYTSDTSGNIYFPLPGPGSYPWTISAGSRFASQTGTLTVSGSCTSSGLLSTYTLSAATGYSCATNATGSLTGCNAVWPLADPLTFTCAVGTVSLYRQGDGTYQGCGTFTTSNLDTQNNPALACLGTTTTGDTGYLVYFAPNSSQITITVYRNLTSTTFTANAWTTCPTTPSFRCNTVGSTLINSGSLTYSCPDITAAFSASGSITGLGGIFSVFNGAVAISE